MFPLLFVLYFADYFSSLSLFTGGLAGAIYYFILFFVFFYFGNRGYKEYDPYEMSMQILAPVFIFAFLCLIAGIPTFVAGVGVVVVYILAADHYKNFKNKKFFFFSGYLFLLLILLSVLPSSLRSITLWLSIIISFITSEYRIRDLEKEKKSKK